MMEKTENKYTDRDKEFLKLVLKLSAIMDRCLTHKVISIAKNKGIYKQEKRLKDLLNKFLEDENIPLISYGSEIQRTDLQE